MPKKTNNRYDNGDLNNNSLNESFLSSTSYGNNVLQTFGNNLNESMTNPYKIKISNSNSTINLGDSNDNFYYNNNDRTPNVPYDRNTMGKLDESSLSKNGYQNNQTVNLSDFKDTTLSTNRAQELEKLRKELNNKNPSPNNSYVNFSYNSNPKHTTPLKSKKDDFNNNSLLSSIRSNHLLKTATFPNNQHSSSALQNKSAQSLLWQIIKEFKNEEYQEMEQFVEKLFSKMENDKPKIPENTKYNEKKTQITTLQSQITNINKPNKEDIKKIQETIHNIIEMIDIWRKDRSPSKKPNVRFNSFNKTHKKTQLQQITRYDNIEKVKERNQKWQEKRNKIKNKKTQNSLNNYNNETNRSY